LPEHALVCERHIGVGITKDDIIRQKLPLPPRDMLPISLEEKVICLADTYYGKGNGKLREEYSLAEIIKKFAKLGDENLRRLNILQKLFDLPLVDG